MGFGREADNCSYGDIIGRWLAPAVSPMFSRCMRREAGGALLRSKGAAEFASRTPVCLWHAGERRSLSPPPRLRSNQQTAPHAPSHTHASPQSSDACSHRLTRIFSSYTAGERCSLLRYEQKVAYTAEKTYDRRQGSGGEGGGGSLPYGGRRSGERPEDGLYAGRCEERNSLD